MNFTSLFIVSIFLFNSSIFAQQVAKPAKKQCDALLTRQIVEQLASESKSVSETDSRVKILIKIADFLWFADQDSARIYFTDAFNAARERFKEKGVEKVSNKGILQIEPDYRFEVIKAVAKRDSEWAKKLTDIVVKDLEESIEKQSNFDSERTIGQLLGVAAETAGTNPDFTLSVSRMSMKYPLSSNWYFLLYQIASKNRLLADQIHTELLNNYRNAEVFRLLYLSAYPFGQSRIIGVDKYSFGTSIPANFQPNQTIQKQFLNVLFRKMLNLSPENIVNSTNSNTSESVTALFAINEIEQTIMPRFPEFNQLFTQTKLHISSIVSNSDLETTKQRGEFNDSVALSFEERLEQLEKSDELGQLTDTEIVKLLISAKKEDDFIKGYGWLDKIKNESTRIQTTNYFYYLWAKNDVAEKRYDEARKHSQKIEKIENRSIIYFEIAETVFKETNNKSEAIDALLEVEKIVNKTSDSVAKAQVYLGLANIYLKFDNFNALDALSNAVKTVNKLENENIFTKFNGQQIQTENFSFFAGYSLPGFDLNEVFYEFGKSDFQSALNYAQSFSNKYYRTLAVLAVVKDCEKNIKPTNKVKKQ